MRNDKAVTIQVPLHARSDRRGGGRVPAAMPLQVGDALTTTQDLSSTGLSFVSGEPYAVGARIDVVIEYLLDGHHYPWACQVEVMRVEAGPGGYTIGARLAPLEGPA